VRESVFIHQTRNGKFLVWDGVNLLEARRMSFRNLKKLVDLKGIRPESKEFLLKFLQKQTTEEGSENPKELTALDLEAISRAKEVLRSYGISEKELEEKDRDLVSD